MLLFLPLIERGFGMRDDIVLSKMNVTNQVEIAPDVFLLSFERNFDFIAGQVVALSINETIPPRIYSIASGEHERQVDILYDVKEGGVLTPELQKLRIGDTIKVSNPYGNFTGEEGKAYWIATGTGIAPFISMLKSGYATNKTLIHGARKEPFFYFAELLENGLGDRYIRCCSQCHNKELYAGRLTRYLSQLNVLPVNQNYYLCGVAEMVVDVRDLLIAKGIPYNQIISEIYF